MLKLAMANPKQIEELHEITSINFGILSDSDIKGQAVCKIDSVKLNGPGSVYDPRMGYKPDDNKGPCVTCGLEKDCTGHFGYIDLYEPVIHPMTFKMVTAFLVCVCKNCHRLLMSQDQMEMQDLLRVSGAKRFNRLREHVSKVTMCSHGDCGSPQPKITYKDGAIIMTYKQKKSDENGGNVSIALSVEEVKQILDNISDADVRLMGFDPERNRPRDLVLTVFPVLPPCSRPHVITEGKICDDDLTHQYMEILKLNTALAKAEEKVENAKEKSAKNINLQKIRTSLRFRIATLYNNSQGKAKHPTDKRAIKGIKERISGKEGQIRNNHMGKRVDFSARTVIGAEPTLKLGQVAIPHYVAQIHTKPEKVTRFNKDWLTEIVNRGEANTIIKGDTKKIIQLKYGRYTRGTELQYGDLIIRGKKDIEIEEITEPDSRMLDVGIHVVRGLDVTEIQESRMKKLKQGDFVVPVELQVIYVIDPHNTSFHTDDRIIRRGKVLDTKHRKQKRVFLNIGDVVERHLRGPELRNGKKVKGDIVLFNRQPTLHKNGMMAHEVVPMKGKTFRFNLAGAKQFNADKRHCQQQEA